MNSSIQLVLSYSCISQFIPALKYITTLSRAARFLLVGRLRGQTQVSVITCLVQEHRSANISLRTNHFIFDRYYMLLSKTNQPSFYFQLSD